MEHFAAFVAGEISEEYVDFSVDLAGETSAGVLGKKDFRVPPKRARNGEGFDGGHIQHGAAEVSGVEVFHECVLVQRGAAAHVTNDGVRLKAGEASVTCFSASGRSAQSVTLYEESAVSRRWRWAELSPGTAMQRFMVNRQGNPK